jgi:hypothetical protein
MEAEPSVWYTLFDLDAVIKMEFGNDWPISFPSASSISCLPTKLDAPGGYRI